MQISRLISYGFVGIISYSLFFSEAYAEYYWVRSRPAVHYIESETYCYTPHKHKHKHKAKKHKYRHHYRHHCAPCYSPCRNEPEIAEYYIQDDFPPAACSCEPCRTDFCAPCGCSGSSIYYVPPSRSYILETYDYNFGGMDFDRRTADDIGSDMDIDY